MVGVTAATRGGPGHGGGGRPLDGDGGKQEVGPLPQLLKTVAASLPRTLPHVVQGPGIPSLLLGPEPARDLLAYLLHPRGLLRSAVEPSKLGRCERALARPEVQLLLADELLQFV